MEQEDRPSKIRKLSHGPQPTTIVSSTTPDIIPAVEITTSEGEKDDGGVSSPPAPEPDPDGSLEITPANRVPKPECQNGESLNHGLREDDHRLTEDDHRLTEDDHRLTEDDHRPTRQTTHVPTREEIAPIAQSIAETAPSLSKSQQKKILKKAEWEAKREDRKVVRKEKVAAKRGRKRTARREAAQSNGAADGEDGEQKKLPSKKAVQLPVTILIDCDFDDLMRDNERISLAAQITRSYSDNRNTKFRAYLAVCSFGGKLKERFDGILNEQYKSWQSTRFLPEDFLETSRLARDWMNDDGRSTIAGAFEAQGDDPSDAAAAKSKALDAAEIIYLTSDSPNTLDRLKPYSTYIIGGLVDKNREKGICYKRAIARGVKTARLPIGELMDMQSRKVLATNHVNEIMLKWLESGDWGEAFMKVIPKRKGGQLKGQAKQDCDEADADNGGVDIGHDGDANAVDGPALGTNEAGDRSSPPGESYSTIS